MSIKIANILKVLLITYVFTCIMLLVLSFSLYKFRFSNIQINIGITMIYGLSTVCGGYFLARMQKRQRLMWGIVFGFLYFVVLSMVSFVINKSFYSDGNAAIRALVICIIGGIIGGILSPPSSE